MYKYEINVYGENDEILTTYSTNIVRWGLVGEAIKLKETMDDMEEEEMKEAIDNFTLKMFPGMEREELELCDFNDMVNNFQMVVAKGLKFKTVKGERVLQTAQEK